MADSDHKDWSKSIKYVHQSIYVGVMNFWRIRSNTIYLEQCLSQHACRLPEELAMNRLSCTSIVLLSAVAFMAPFSAVPAAQSCVPNIPQTTPGEDFVDHGNGTVTHKKTGLMWSQCLLGQSGSDCTSGNSNIYTWEKALEVTAASTLAGYNDWRLPNVKELGSIVEEACYDPAINLSIFPNTPSEGVWSASPGYNAGYDAWIFSYYWGACYPAFRDNRLRVRLVRGRQ